MDQCARLRGQLSQGDDGSGEGDRGFIAEIGFVVSRVHGTEFFDFAEVILDEVTPSIFDGIMGNGRFSIGLRRNDSLRSTAARLVADRVIVEGLVAQQRLEGQAVKEFRYPDAVVALSRQQHEAHQVAQRIDQRQNLRGQAAFRPADGLMASPPFAPLAF